MPHFFRVYLLPAGLINLGNVFGYLFQLTIARTLAVADVGAFSAIFALTNVITAPAAVLSFAVARTMITTSHIEGAANSIIARSASGALLMSVFVMAGGALLIEPVGAALHVERHLTVNLALFLMCTNVLYCLAIGWYQGGLRYIASSLALASIPALRCLFGVWLLIWWSGGVDAAVASTALPGAIIFVAAFAALYRPASPKPGVLPAGTWRDFGRFLLSSSASSLLLLGFWNLDVVMVRVMFSPEASGLYAVASVLGRIPYLLTVALANVLFSEATRSGYGGESAERAARKVLLQNFALAFVLGLLAAVPLSLFAQPVLVMFGGVAYAASAPILQVLSFAMALLALLQIVATYMLARNQHYVLWLLAIGLATFLVLGGLLAHSAVEIVSYLAGTIGTILVVCLMFVFLKRGRSPISAPIADTGDADENVE
jgi:O-antigen/teichoic acid export membrane protein